MVSEVDRQFHFSFLRERNYRVGHKVHSLKLRKENKVNKYEFSEYTKIRDVKFSPHRPELLAVQSSSKLELLDIRKGMEILSTY